MTEPGRPDERIVAAADTSGLQRGIDEGRIRPATSGVVVGMVARHRSSMRTADVLDEDRR